MGLGMGLAMANRMAGMQSPALSRLRRRFPAPVAANWHVAVNGQTQGPFTLPQIAQGISAGQLNRESLVWSQGMASWTPAGQVPQLGAAFAASASPPPPPPPAPK